MEVQDISKVMNAYISNQEMLGGALIVRKNDEIIYQNKWGFQNLEHSRSIEYDTMYRLMSMSKCVTGVAVMKLIEEGKIRLDDKVSKYIPEFAGLPVCCDPRYISQNLKKRKMVWNLLTFRMDKVKTEPAKREITIRDLLSHASGLEQAWKNVSGVTLLISWIFSRGQIPVIHQWQALIFWDISSVWCLEKALKNICGKKFLHLWK